MRVEIALHPVQRIAFQVAPVIFVDETGGCDGGARRAVAQFRLLLRG
jgi:hypothetical protein